MQIIPVPVSGVIDTLSYFYAAEDFSAFLIDPGAEADKLKRIAAEKTLAVKAILLTHSHYDHIGAAGELATFWNIPVYGGINAKKNAEDPKRNLSAFMNSSYSLENVEEKEEGSILKLDENHSLKVIETPGHTTDSVIYHDKAHDVAFVGDTIFENSYGRTDLPGGNEEALFKSIKEKVFALPDNTTLFSGHSNPTTVAAEKTCIYYR